MVIIYPQAYTDTKPTIKVGNLNAAAEVYFPGEDIVV